MTVPAAIVLAVVLGEAMLELAGPSRVQPVSTRSVRLKENSPGWAGIQRPTADVLAIADGLEVDDYPLRIDRNGWIEPSRIHDDPDVTVLFLGGSTTECRLLQERQRWVYRAGRSLEERLGKKINAINGGVSGNNAMHSVVNLIAKGIEAEPDVVVAMHAINDLAILMYNGTYFNRHHSRSLLVDDAQVPGSLRRRGLEIFRLALPRIFGLARAARDRALMASGERTDEWAEERRPDQKLNLDGERIFGDFRSALETFCRTSRAFGIEPVLMTQANRITPEPDDLIRRVYASGVGRHGVEYGAFQQLLAGMNRTTREVAAAEGVTLIDLAAGVPPTRDYLYDPVHLSDAGSELVAAHVAAALEELLSERPATSVDIPGPTGDHQEVPVRP